MEENKYCVLCQEEHVMTAKCIVVNVECKGCGQRGHLRKDCHNGSGVARNDRVTIESPFKTNVSISSDHP